MSFVPLQNSAAAVVVSNFLDAAAQLESRTHDAEARAQLLLRDVQVLQRRVDHTKKWLAAIRKSHRSNSHAATSGLIKRALASLESNSAVTVALF